jgi:pyruvyltransferase
MNLKLMAMTVRNIVFKNRYNREGLRAEKNTVNLELYRDDINLGDYLSQIVCEYMLSLEGLSLSSVSRKEYTHLMAIGSLLGGRGYFDATVWGTGVRSFSEVAFLGINKRIQKLDIRAVRGPITRQIMMQAGHYDCPEIFGDPAVLMPIIYPKKKEKISGRIGLVAHFINPIEIPESCRNNIISIDVKTKNYKSFIDSIVTCEKVISASLHGIILAEAYGIPAIFLNINRDTELLKYYDWYFSSNRKYVKIASSIDEAVSMDCLPLPDLNSMRTNLMNSFPYDLWKH